MGWFDSLCSGISSAFSAVCSTVSSIGSALSSFAVSVGSVIMSAISTVSNVIQIVGIALGIIKPNENIEDLGDKALQAAAAGIHPENFSKYDEYLAEIRAFNINPEKFKSYTTEEKMLAGIGVTCKGIEEKFNLREGSVGQLAAMTALNPIYFNAMRLEKWIATGLDIGKVVDYFDNKLGASDSFKVESEIIATEQQDSNKTEMQIEQEIEQTKTDIYQAAQQLDK